MSNTHYSQLFNFADIEEVNLNLSPSFTERVAVSLCITSNKPFK
jgi:hypothetical protein